MVTTKNATNGKVENKANATSPITQKPELSNLAVGPNKTDAPGTPPQKVELSIHQRLDKLKELNAIKERFDILEDTKEKLSKFKLSSDKNMDMLTIKDGYGNDFRTSNTLILKDVISLITSGIEVKLKEAELQLVF